MNASRTALIETFIAASGWGGSELAPLKGDASFRRYTRLHRGAESAMLMDAPPSKEDVRPYLAIARHLYAQGYSAPRILAEDADAGLLLLEDLGDDLFTPLLKESPQQESVFYREAVALLLAWRAEKCMHPSSALSLPSYDTALLLREVALFSDWYLPKVFGAEKAAELRGEYLAIWEELLRTPPEADVFVHRDYHADNLLWLPEREGAARVGLLDFQDGVWGHAAYDLVSLLEDARRDVEEQTRQACLAQYIQGSGVNAEQFLRDYALLGAQRNCKIIGIFVRLSERDGKHHYLDFLPRVWGHLKRDLQHPALQPLAKWMQALGLKELA